MIIIHILIVVFTLLNAIQSYKAKNMDAFSGWLIAMLGWVVVIIGDL